MQDCPVWGAFQYSSGKLKGWRHEKLTLALRDHVSADYRVMVDSSKTAWGSLSIPLRLFRKLGQNFVLVHLVRDPRGVCWSYMRTPWRPNKASRPLAPKTGALRAAIGWIAANLACELFRWRQPENYVRVRYEDLIQTPAEVIEEILRRVSLASPISLKPNDAKDNRHQLYGNAMRFRPLSVPDLKEDVAWKTLMPRGYRLLIRSLCWPLYRRYGYGRNAGNLPQRSPIASRGR
jgi:hypothetical protein